MLLSLLACTAGENTADTGGIEYWSQLAWANCRAEVDWTDSLHGEEGTSWSVYDDRGRVVDSFDSRVASYGTWERWTYDGDDLLEYSSGSADLYDFPTWRTTHTYQDGRLATSETSHDDLFLNGVTYSYDAQGHLAAENWEERGGDAWVNQVTTDDQGRVVRVDRYDEPDDGEADEWHLTTWSGSAGETTWETESFSANAESMWKLEGETVNQRDDPLSWWYEHFVEGSERRGRVDYGYSEDLRLESRTEIWTYLWGSEDQTEEWRWTWDWTNDGFIVAGTYDNRDREAWSGTWTWTCN